MLMVLEEVRRNARMSSVLYTAFLDLIAAAVDQDCKEVARNVAALTISPCVCSPHNQWARRFPGLNNTIIWGILERYGMRLPVTKEIKADVMCEIAPPEMRDWLVSEFLIEKPDNAGVCRAITEVL